MPVTVAEAALGASIVVPAPDGTKVRVRVPAGTQDETVLNIKGKGAPRREGRGHRRPEGEDRRAGAEGHERGPEEGHGGLPGCHDG